MKDTKYVKVGLRLPADLCGMLRMLSAEHDITLSEFIRECIDQRVERLIRLGMASTGTHEAITDDTIEPGDYQVFMGDSKPPIEINSLLPAW